MGQVVLVTGPTRSGKSEWAEQLAIATQLPVVYVATAQVDPADTEWVSRIQRHQQRRPADWRTYHVPLALADFLRQQTQAQCWLVDALGTWVANGLEQGDEVWQEHQAELLAVLPQVPGTIILVAEETGWGIVPAYPLGRQFRDRLGDLTRHIGAIADTVYLVTAGHALDLGRLGQRLPSAISRPGAS